MQPSKLRLVTSWLLEGIWSLFQIIGLLLPVPLPSYRKGGRGSVIIVTDLLTTPLFYLPLRSAFKNSGFSVYTYAIMNPFRDSHYHAKKLSKYLAKENVSEAILVCHGAGALSCLALPDHGRQRCKYLLTLGSPLNGSRIFSVLEFIPAFGDMIPGSSFLLLNRMNALLFPFFSPFSAWKDQWIYPSNLARFGQGRDLIVDIPGRLNLILSGENRRTYLEQLAHDMPEQLATDMAKKSDRQDAQPKQIEQKNPEPVRTTAASVKKTSRPAKKTAGTAKKKTKKAGKSARK